MIFTRLLCKHLTKRMEEVFVEDLLKFLSTALLLFFNLHWAFPEKKL